MSRVGSDQFGCSSFPIHQSTNLSIWSKNSGIKEYVQCIVLVFLLLRHTNKAISIKNLKYLSQYMCHSLQLTVTCYMHASDILISYWKTWPAFNMISFSPENILISISLFSGSDSSLPQYSGLVPLICAAISMSQTHTCEFIKICLDCLERETEFLCPSSHIHFLWHWALLDNVYLQFLL